MSCNERGELTEYFFLLSDLINLTHKLGNSHGDKKVYHDSKISLNKRIIPGLKKLTNKYIEILENLIDESYPEMFFTEYKSLIDSGKIHEAENFSRNWLRHVRDGKSCPVFKMTYQEDLNGTYEVW